MLRRIYATRLRVYTILLAAAASQQALAQDENWNLAPANQAVPESEGAVNHAEPGGVAKPAVKPPKLIPGPPPAARWVPPQPEQAKQINEKVEKGPAQVRIGLRLTPFHKIVTREKDGTQSARFVPVEPLRHTLRARLNKVNHFFVGDYHVETEPRKWVRKSRRYEVRLHVYRRFGAFGQLEEALGDVDLSGVLDEQEDNVHVLLGVARKRLRDKFQSPVLDVVAGFTPAPSKTGPVATRGGGIPPAPAGSGEILRGRF